MMPTSYRVTPTALQNILSLRQRHPTLQAGLMMVSGFDAFDEAGNLEAHFEGDHFMMAYDSEEYFAEWPRIVLKGHVIPIHRDALEKLDGKTLSLEDFHIQYNAGGEDDFELLVAI